MKQKKQQLFSKIFFLALASSTILQAIGLTFLAISRTQNSVFSLITIPLFVMSLCVSILPDAIMILAELKSDLEKRYRDFVMIIGGVFSLVLSAITSYVAVSATAINSQFETIEIVTLIGLLLIQLAILTAEWMTKTATLEWFLDGQQEDFDSVTIAKLKQKTERQAKQFGLSNYAEERINFIAEMMEQSHDKNASAFIEMAQILQRISNQIENTKTQIVAPPKLSLPNPNDEKSISDFYFVLSGMIGDGAINKTGLAKSIGISKAKLDKITKGGTT